MSKIMWRVIGVVVVGIVGVLGYYLSAQQEKKVLTTDSNSIVQDIEKKEEPFVFAGKKQTSSNADMYKGYAVVEGQYMEYYPETLNGGKLLFKVDEQYKTKLPKKYSEYVTWFAINNDASAKQMLQVDESVFNDKSICELSGRAKIAIENYTSVLAESEILDSADLVKVISFTPQTTEICPHR